MVVAALAVLAGCVAPVAPVAPVDSVATEPPHPSTPPASAEVVDADAVYVEARLADMSPREKALSVLMVRLPSKNPEKARQAIHASGVAGVILLEVDTRSSASVAAELTAALVSDPGLPPIVAIDQEGGIVARLADDGPSARDLATLPPEASRAAFEARAKLVARAGVAINFGIVADVTDDKRSFLAPRVFGGDAASVAERVAAAVEGEHGTVLSTLKHFPGHGGAPGDSHAEIPETGMTLERWRRTQAPPFQAGIDAGAELVMTGHLRYRAVDDAPASLSESWYRILRDELGFTGVAVTDDLSMLEASGESRYSDPVANAQSALRAGADLLLFVGPVDVQAAADGIAQAVEAGEIPAERLDEAARRVLELRRGLATSDAPDVRCAEDCLDAAE